MCGITLVSAHIVPFDRIFNFSYEGFLDCGSGEMTQLIFGCDGIPNDCFDNSDESPYCVGGKQYVLFACFLHSKAYLTIYVLKLNILKVHKD